MGVGPNNIFIMRLIILSGEDNCGKTTTLNSLANKIEISGLYLKEKIPKGNPQQKDFDYVFYKNPDYSGKPIIISTWGDYPQLLQECCEKYIDAELIVCACNMRFMHGRKFKPFVDAMKYDRFATIVLKKDEINPEKQEIANEEYTDYLYSILKYFGIL